MKTNIILITNSREWEHLKLNSGLENQKYITSNYFTWIKCNDPKLEYLYPNSTGSYQKKKKFSMLQ